MRAITLLCALLTCCAVAHGAAVGVLETEKRTQGVIDTLQAEPNFPVKVLKKLTAETLAGLDVVIIAGEYDPDAAREAVRKAAQSGAGVFFMHRTVMDGGATFPEIIWEKATGERNGADVVDTVKPIRTHPITAGLPKEGFGRAHWLHSFTLPVDSRQVLLEDFWAGDEFTDRRLPGMQTRWAPYRSGHAVLVASPFGKGRVVFCGVCFGLNRADHQVKMTGIEKTLFMNCMRWLAKETPLDLPEPSENEGALQYRTQYDRGNPRFALGAVRLIDALRKSPQAEKAVEVSVGFALPESAPLDRVIPVRLACPKLGFRPASVLLEGESCPVQMEKGKDGAPVALFTGCFNSRENEVTLSTKACGDAPVSVRVSPDGRLAEISTDAFRIITAVEAGKPSIQSIQVQDRGWHHTWDGIERANLSAPLARIAESLRPFEGRPYRIYHERGLDLPRAGTTAKTVAFPVCAELQVGTGRLTVYHTGQIVTESFEGPTRLATWLFDGYAHDGTFTLESASYDFPSTEKGWVWAVKNDRYALGGTLEFTGRMGETGLAPGLEREAVFGGGLIAIATGTDDLARLQGPMVSVTVQATEMKESGSQPAKPVAPLRLQAKAVSLRKLWKMRGTNDFHPVLPQPVEICRDELESAPGVTVWKIEGNEELLLTSAPGEKTARTIPDTALEAAEKVLDPFGEDVGHVWRRVFLAWEGDRLSLEPQEVVLRGLDDAGKCVLEVPVMVRTLVTVPMGIFTYSSQWLDRKELTPPEQWPKLMRDIALAELDYIIHVGVLGDEQENPPNIENRLKRYGLWWLADIGRPGHKYSTSKRTPEDAAALEKAYEEVIGVFGAEPNVLGWLLSEELPSGEVENGVVPQGYKDAALFYELAGKFDAERPRINLISVYFTPYETATEHIKSDLFSWDPYGIGTKHALAATEKVRTQWQEVRNLPSWITLRCCGPIFSDCFDHWLDIRRRSLAAYKGGVDGINYFMYSHWLKNMEQFTYYAVFPGSQGPIASLRRHVLSEISEDVALLSTAEYLLQTSGVATEAQKTAFLEALDLGVAGNFHAMRAQLNTLIAELNK